MARSDGREADQLREVRITPGVARFAEGSALIEMGLTKVLCTATIDERVPPFLRGRGRGWVTAEYAMLPRSTAVRTPRETTPRGRSQEIQRLIGRSLRAATDMAHMGERTITIDCDVLQADGGTRTAAITGGYVALYQALRWLVTANVVPQVPVKDAVAAVSVGIIDGEPLLDLCYEEDAEADVDCNVVMTRRGLLVEAQATAEGAAFDRRQMDAMLDLAAKGVAELVKAQDTALRAM